MAVGPLVVPVGAVGVRVAQPVLGDAVAALTLELVRRTVAAAKLFIFIAAVGTLRDPVTHVVVEDTFHSAVGSTWEFEGRAVLLWTVQFVRAIGAVHHVVAAVADGDTLVRLVALVLVVFALSRAVGAHALKRSVATSTVHTVLNYHCALLVAEVVFDARAVVQRNTVQSMNNVAVRAETALNAGLAVVRKITLGVGMLARGLHGTPTGEIMLPGLALHRTQSLVAPPYGIANLAAACVEGCNGVTETFAVASLVAGASLLDTVGVVSVDLRLGKHPAAVVEHVGRRDDLTSLGPPLLPVRLRRARRGDSEVRRHRAAGHSGLHPVVAKDEGIGLHLTVPLLQVVVRAVVEGPAHAPQQALPRAGHADDQH